MMHTFVLRVWRSSRAGVEELVAAEEDALLGAEVEVATTIAEMEANRTNFNPFLNRFKYLISLNNVAQVTANPKMKNEVKKQTQLHASQQISNN